jgi:hypothetical protein
MRLKGNKLCVGRERLRLFSLDADCFTSYRDEIYVLFVNSSARLRPSLFFLRFHFADCMDAQNHNFLKFGFCGSFFARASLHFVLIRGSLMSRKFMSISRTVSRERHEMCAMISCLLAQFLASFFFGEISRI